MTQILMVSHVNFFLPCRIFSEHLFFKVEDNTALVNEEMDIDVSGDTTVDYHLQLDG